MALLALLRPLLPPTATPLRRRSFLPHFRPSSHPLHRPSLSGGVRTVSHSPSSSRTSVEASGGLPSPLAQDSHAKAFWVTRDIIASKVSEDITACYLYASKCATLYLADSVEGDGKCCDVTSLQLPGVLDDVYAYTGPLGATLTEESIILHLWAPTAQGGFWLRMQELGNWAAPERKKMKRIGL